MNFIWKILILVSLICLCLSSPASTLPAFLEGSSSALSLSLELFSIYAVWLGIIKIVENTALSRGLSKILSPLINLLWGKDISPKAKEYLSLSLSTSLLGIGGASVPLGIKAVEELDDKSGTVTFPIIMTIVFASSGVQFLPTTVMSLMTASGSTNPSFIIVPTLLSGLVTTIVGVCLAFLFKKLSKKQKVRS